ncbi:RNA exonuclease 1-like protein [Dirofilaria immitis]|nr:RNA exonuclease 1-like protein [Dirofilaria immitis]
MIGRSGLFADIMCPYDEDCIRPHCHFWHSKDDQQQQQPSLSSMSTVPLEQPFVGYVGYVENQKTTIKTTTPICSQSIYAPLDPVVYTQRPPLLTAQHNALKLFHHTSRRNTSFFQVPYVPTKITPRSLYKRMPSPEIPKPAMPVELSVDEILDPANDKPKILLPRLLTLQNTKVPEMSLNDYAKSVADIDTRIEELQRKIEIERQQKEKIVHDIRALVKSPAAVNSDSLVAEKHSSSNSKSRLTYTGGYTPTPIALLKSVEKAKNEARQKKKLRIEENDNEKEGIMNLKNKMKRGKMKDKNKTKDVKMKKVANVEATKLHMAVPTAKKRKNVDNDLKSKTGRMSEKVEKQKEVEIKMEVKNRITHSASNMQSTVQMCVTTNKVRTPTIAQQLMNRYQKLQKEKEELLRNLKFKEEIKVKQITTAEEKYDYKSDAVAATVSKGEKRIAHTSKISKCTEVNLIPLDPYSCGKVPYALRTRYLNLFYIECQKFCGSSSDAITLAQQEEKTIKDRAVTKGGYTSAAVNVLRRLRDVNSPQTGALKSVSHSAILAGRHHGSITIGQRKYSASGKQTINESEFYRLLLSKFVLNEQELKENGFPLWEDLRRICCRCGTEFSLTSKGEYAALKQCVYHWGKAYKTKTRGLWESRYNCCQSDLNVAGCCVADCHVTDTSPKSVLECYQETPPPSGPKDERSRKVYAFDCEMIYTAWGTNLARISVVDVNDKLVMDVIVRPQYEVRDCNTRFSGLTMDQIEKAEFNLEQTQKRFFELVNSETILIGHSLESDLKAMRLIHHRVVDTSIVFPHRLGPPYKRALKTIASEILQLIIQEDIDGHDSKEDASTCMRVISMNCCSKDEAHKYAKKTLGTQEKIGSCICSFLLHELEDLLDCDIRTVYAREAKQFGDIPLTSAGHLRRVAVLVDTTCTSAFDSFKKNALPLFNLAGLQVEIIRPTDISEFKTIAEHIDTTECDALYVIGGDNALSCVLSAMYRQKNNSPVPIGVFPSGAENRSLIAIQNDIRPCCESAMALIEEKIRPIYLSSIRFENSESNTNEEKQSLYGVSGLHVGWYDRVEANKNKLWYWGRLKRWIAYITATLRSLKQYPEIELDMVCEEYCAGCCKCRSQAITEEIKQQTNKHWWHYIIGSRNYTAVNGMKPKMDYSIIKNENCGKTREMKVKAVDITIENIQDQNACGIRIRTGGAGRSRISLLMDGWMRCQTKQLSASPNTDFYQNDLHYVKKWIGLPDFDKLEWDMIQYGLFFFNDNMTKLPKVDEELHAKTIFEPVSAEVRPAKTKPKARSKLKWKEGLEPKGKTEESKDSDINSDQAIRLNVKIKKESDQMKVATKDKSDRSIVSTSEIEQSILWMIVRKLLEEILVWLIIIIILIITRIRG